MSSAKENGPKRPSSSSNGNSDSADKGPADPKSSGAVFSLANHNKPELAEISLDPPCNVNAGPSGSNLYDWVATIQGPDGSPYENGIFFLSVKFPVFMPCPLTVQPEYPFAPPKLRFKTRIYHCNVSPAGEICLDVLKDNWSPALTISKVLLSVVSLLTDANPDDPLVSSIAGLYLSDREEHDRVARDWTKRFAC
ncbi:MAG: hypothetical protein SGCHY_000361 [Lobulomycetales sp.]